MSWGGAGIRASLVSAALIAVGSPALGQEAAPIEADIPWSKAQAMALPSLVTARAADPKACHPYIDSIWVCHLLLSVGEGLNFHERRVSADDLARWRLDESDVARQAVANLDHRAAVQDLDIVWVGDGRPEYATHSTRVGTAAAWLLTPAFTRKLQALWKGDWFVAMTSSDDFYAWPVDLPLDRQSGRVQTVHDLVDLARRQDGVLSEHVYLWHAGQLRVATAAEIGAQHALAPLSVR